MSSSTIEAPWSVTYHDGSNNRVRFWREAGQAGARFEYTPVRPESSSSGTYSGGEPARGDVDPAEVEALWGWVARLEADESLRTTSRKMGTGGFSVADSRGPRSFVIEDGEVLRDFETFVARFRSRR